MKKFFVKTLNFLEDNIIKIILLVPYILIIVLTLKYDLAGCFVNKKFDEIADINMALIYFCSLLGNFALIFLFSGIYYLFLRHLNKDEPIFTKNIYHQYYFIWYKVCTKLLAYGKTDYKMVPIYLQFKCSIQRLFKEYVFNELEYPISDGEVIVTKYNNMTKEVNIVIEDTFKIEDNQLPENKLHTIKISLKHNEISRCYSERFVSTVNDVVRNLPEGTKVNLYCTTNPKHTHMIAISAFAQSNRGNLSSLYVYQQERIGQRKFVKKHKIYGQIKF